MANIKGILVEIGGDTSGLQKALKKVNSATSSLNKELKGVNSLLKLDPKNTELVSQKQKNLAENIQETSDKLKILKQIQEKANEAMANETKISDENYRNLQREIIKTENKLKELQAQASKWTTAGKNIEEFGNKLKNISDKIDKMGTTLTTRLTIPIAGIATAAITTGNNFEAQMSRVQAIAGATKDELENLTDQAIQLGAETSFGATEVAQGMENLASAGFTTKEIMKAMPGLLDLAASSGADLAISSEIAASAIRGFGLEASRASHIADVFAEASARTNAQTEDMGEAMKYVAPVAKTVGLSLEETAAAIGIMSDAGVKGSQAGTTLRGGLTRIVKPTKMVKDAMETLSVEFYDSEGKMKSLTEIIGILQKSTSSLTDETKNQALAQIFGTEALSGMLALINRGPEELNSMTKSFEKCDGAASKMADTMLDNASGAIEEMKGSIESAGIAIQQALAPEIKGLAKQIQNLVDDFNDLSDEEKHNIIKTVGLVAAIGPATKAIGILGKTIGNGTKAIGTFSQAIALVRNNSTSTVPSVNNLANVIKGLTSPVGLTITSISTLAGAYIFLKNEADKLPEKLQRIAEETERAKESHKEYRSELDRTTSSNLAQIKNTEDLRNELSKLVDENGKVKEGYKDRVSLILKELNEALGTEYSLTGDVIGQYKKLQDEIDLLILKKNAQIILENEEQKHTEALKNKDEVYQKLLDSQSKYNEVLKGKTYEQFFEDLKQNYIDTGYTAEKSAEYAKDWMSKWIDSYKGAYETNKSIYDDYIDDISKYENDFTTIQSNNTDEIKKMVNARIYNYGKENSTREEQIKSGIKQELYNIQELKRMREEDLKNQDEISAVAHANSIESGKKRLQSLVENLKAQTSITNENSQEVINAWKELADGSYGYYSEVISEAPLEMQKKIQEMTRVIAGGTPQMQEKAEELGRKTVEEFDKSADAKTKALNIITGYLRGLTDEEKREFLKQAGIENADIVLSELDKENLSEENGKNILKGLWNGLKNNTLQGKILGVASGLAQAVNKAFTGKNGWDEHSPSKKMKKFTEYYIQPISDIMNARKKSIISTAQSLANRINETFNEKMNITPIKDFGKLQGSLNKEITNNTSTVNNKNKITLQIYPQHLTEAELDRTFDYLDRKFGQHIP